MFAGSHDHVLDDKGRTSLPKEYRQILSGMPGDPWLTTFSECLTLFTPAEFEVISEKLSNASSTMPDILDLQRLILGNAARCPIDRQGRIFIVPQLRTWAGLSREIVFLGLGRRIEVWSKERRMENLEYLKGSYPTYSANSKDYGL